MPNPENLTQVPLVHNPAPEFSLYEILLEEREINNVRQSSHIILTLS